MWPQDPGPAELWPVPRGLYRKYCLSEGSPLSWNGQALKPHLAHLFDMEEHGSDSQQPQADLDRFLADRWGNTGNRERLYFLGSKITADGDFSHEIRRCLLLGRKAMTNLDSILKSRGATLPTKVSLGKAMIFPVVMYGCESWTIKKAECYQKKKKSWVSKNWWFWTLVL